MVENRKQEYCSATGAFVLMASGLVTLSVWSLCSNSAAMRMFEPRLMGWLQRLGSVFLTLGCVGVLATWRKWTVVLLSYGCLVLLLSGSCFVLSTAFFVTVYGDVLSFSDACQMVQFNRSAALPPGVQAFQEAYDSMRRALEFCRQYKPVALRLDVCQDALDKVAPNASAYGDLFRSLEASYSCSGLCFNDVSLFALPDGNVTWDNKLQQRPACYAPMMGEVQRLSILACGTLWLIYLWLVLPACSACWLACAAPMRKIPGYVHNPEELHHYSTVDDHYLEEQDDDLEVSESQRLLCG